MLFGAAFAASYASQAMAQASPTQGTPAAVAPSTDTSINATGASNTVQAIVITGSRIPQTNLVSNSPVTTVGSPEIQAQGTTSVETLLTNLPSVLPDQNQSTDNGATGTAQIALRGLTPNRTLVLVDGKRLMPGDPAMQAGNVIAPDLNNIPAALVDRVEVLTGGASSVYGSDAVAGVVNFIMKKNLNGVRFDGQYGFSIHQNDNSIAQSALSAYNSAHSTNPIAVPGNHADGYTYNLSLALGMNTPDAKGNITAYVTHLNMQPVSQGKRDYGACGISTLVGPPDSVVCQGSSNSAYGRFFGPNKANNPDGTNTFVPYSGAYAFNFGPYNYYQREDNRYTAGYFAHYEIAKALDVYSDFMFADDSTIGLAAPSGLFNTAKFTLSCDNPLASPSQLATLCGATAGTSALTTQIIGYRFAGVPRTTSLFHTAYRADVGLRGDLGHGWSYDVYGQYGHVRASETFTGDVSITKIDNALNVGLVNGVPTCRTDVANCVPLDIFHALSSGITQKAINYVLTPALKSGSTTEEVVSGSITGNLAEYGIKSPWATDGLGVAFGAEYRREELALTVDQEFSSGDLSGNGAALPPANGNFDVRELFAEVRAPILQDAPFARSLTFEGGWRYSDYSSAGKVASYKAALDWAPIEDIRFRGGYNRAVRAPNVAELYQPVTVQLATYSDPCSGASPTLSLALCERTGLPAAQYGHVPDCGAAQCSILTGGNTALRPERSDTFTIGAVATPTFLHNFNASIDYFYIIVNDALQQGYGNGTGSVILSQCITAGQFCNLIHRDPTNGALFGLTAADGYVNQLTVNSGYVKTSGFDITANYHTNFSDWSLPDWGGLAFSYVGTITREFVQSPVKDLGSYNCVGLFGLTCLQPMPKYRHELRTTWTTPWRGFSLSLNWRYIGPSNLDLNQSGNTFLATQGSSFFDTADAHIPAYNYFDLSASVRLTDRIVARAGINNLFDKDPPILDANNVGVTGPANFGNGNTFPGVYDTLGRTVFVGLTAAF